MFWLARSPVGRRPAYVLVRLPLPTRTDARWCQTVDRIWSSEILKYWADRHLQRSVRLTPGCPLNAGLQALHGYSELIGWPSGVSLSMCTSLSVPSLWCLQFWPVQPPCAPPPSPGLCLTPWLWQIKVGLLDLWLFPGIRSLEQLSFKQWVHFQKSAHCPLSHMQWCSGVPYVWRNHCLTVQLNLRLMWSLGLSLHWACQSFLYWGLVCLSNKVSLFPPACCRATQLDPH